MRGQRKICAQLYVGIINQTQRSWRYDQSLEAWSDGFPAQPSKHKHRRRDGVAIAEGEANAAYARSSPQVDVSNDPYFGTP
jgi:hypothetical protein